MRLRSILAVIVLALGLAGCGTAPVRSGTYTVRSGDTLYAIAQRFRLDYRELARWNGIGRGYQIYPGQVLRLYAGAGRESSASVSPLPAPPPAASFTWSWPATGVEFKPSARPNGGVGLIISGREHQDIYAAAPGKVVYSGTGLLGYGRLLIIKHDEAYLSAYGYTQDVFVGEGAQVDGGQKIATMGKDPAGTPQLYFEIRINGKPVDPLLLLPRQR